MTLLPLSERQPTKPKLVEEVVKNLIEGSVRTTSRRDHRGGADGAGDHQGGADETRYPQKPAKIMVTHDYGNQFETGDIVEY